MRNVIVGAMGRYVAAKGWLASRVGYGHRSYRAYVPHPLRDWEPQLSAAAVETLVAAQSALERITALPHTDLGSALADWMTARDESIRTSAIENIHTTTDAFAWARYREQVGRPVSDANETLTLGASRQIAAAVALGRQMSEGHACTVDDILRLHMALFENIRDHDIGGTIRAEPIWVGPAGCLIDDATFVAPPPEHLEGLLNDLVGYINGSGHTAVLRAAIVHAQFETIHPFEDGNGRTGRALIQAVLNAHRLAGGTVPISTALERDRAGYYAALNDTRVDCVVDDTATRSRVHEQWIRRFGEACESAYEQAERTAGMMERLVEKWQRQARFRAGSASARLLAHLPSMPVLDTGMVSVRLGVSERVARNAVKALASAGILDTAGGERNVRYTVADLVGAMRQMQPDGVMTHSLGTRPPPRGNTPASVVPNRPGPPPCGHRGPRSRKPCVLPRGHGGQHRYRRR